MKSHVWNLWGKKFVIDSTPMPRGAGIEVEGREYVVHVHREGAWEAVREDVAVGVLLSFLSRYNARSKDDLMESRVPEAVHKTIRTVMRQFEGRDKEANAYALCVLCSQKVGLLESGTLREAM